jgi:hypothetical protein
VGIEVFPARDHVAVTLYSADGWQERGEDSDYVWKNIVSSLALVGVPRPEAEELVRETVAHIQPTAG